MGALPTSTCRSGTVVFELEHRTGKRAHQRGRRLDGVLDACLQESLLRRLGGAGGDRRVRQNVAALPIHVNIEKILSTIFLCSVGRRSPRPYFRS
jgi:hypothetical protein